MPSKFHLRRRQLLRNLAKFYKRLQRSKHRKAHHHRGAKHDTSAVAAAAAGCSTMWIALPRKRTLSHSLPDLHNLYGIGDRPPSYEQIYNVNAEHEQAPLCGSMLNREWEIVTVEEVRRRLSLSDLTPDLKRNWSIRDFQPGNLPLPAGCSSSRILDEPRIRQFLEVLPAKAEGYPWRLIYSSFDHGFSLRTLYRKMADFGDEMSPVVILIRDTTQRVFGACVSSPILLDGHNFRGVGDSCFLFTYYPVPARFIPPTSPVRDADEKQQTVDELRCYNWTGENQYFVNATSDWLAVGQSSGHYGLWLDADMNKGRTMKCATFNNDPLTDTQNGDFQLDSIECWGFALDEPPHVTLDGLL